MFRKYIIKTKSDGLKATGLIRLLIRNFILRSISLAWKRWIKNNRFVHQVR